MAVLIARGLTNRQIAEALVITEGTAANHVDHILNKLGLQLTGAGRRLGRRARPASDGVTTGHSTRLTPPCTK